MERERIASVIPLWTTGNATSLRLELTIGRAQACQGEDVIIQSL